MHNAICNGMQKNGKRIAACKTLSWQARSCALAASRAMQQWRIGVVRNMFGRPRLGHQSKGC
eukprot:7930924-Lingulodinium_polyedra.AAC.1